MAGPKRRLPVATVILALAFAVVLTAVEARAVASVVQTDNSVYLGKNKIVNASSALSGAKANLNAIVSKRRGVQAADSRCYFQGIGADNLGHDQIATQVWCGPVLFIADTPGADYLQFSLSSVTDSHLHGAGLKVATSPNSDTPVPLGGSVQLERPDGATPKAGEQLAAPPVPAGDKDLFVKTNFVGTPPPPGATPTQMGSLNGGIVLQNFGPTTTYGSGDDTRKAAPGQKLIAFKTYGAEGNLGDVIDLSPQASVTVDHGTARALPTGTEQFYVVAVAAAATAVDLELHDGGLNQSISLLDGKPAATNIAVLARTDRFAAKNTTPYSATYSYSPEVLFPDGSAGTSAAATITMDGGELQYQETFGGTTVKASSTSAAILILDVSYTETHHSGTYLIDPAFVTFTPAGGTALPVRELDDTTTKKAELVVEVPGTTKSGTINIGGAENLPYGDSAGTFRLSVSAVSIPASFIS
jgi:hypothetical protein